jgi:hypothetical protein
MIFANLFLVGTFFYGTFLLNCANGTGHDEEPPNSSLPRNVTHRSTAGNIADLGEVIQFNLKLASQAQFNIAFRFHFLTHKPTTK